MNESGTVVDVRDGVATVSLPRGEACGGCRLCLWSAETSSMLIRATAPPGTHAGDHVQLTVDRRMRTRAQACLRGAPLAAFLATALVARLGLGISDGAALLASVGALAVVFVAVSLVDRRRGWSTRPMARIVCGGDEDAPGGDG